MADRRVRIAFPRHPDADLPVTRFSTADSRQLPYESWCVHLDGFRFVYLHGLSRECLDVLQGLEQGSYLFRRSHASQEEARVHCEGAAAQANGAYGGQGQAQVVLAADVLAQPLSERNLWTS